MNTGRRNAMQLALAAGLAACGPWAGAQTRPAPALLAGMDHEGQRIDLAAYRGQVVLVSFYSMACAVCPSELTLIREFQAANKARGFSAIAVSLDAREEDFRTYAQLQKLTIAPRQQFPVVWRAAPRHQDSFGPVTRHPTHVLVTRGGQPALRREGGLLPADWDDIWLALG